MKGKMNHELLAEIEGFLDSIKNNAANGEYVIMMDKGWNARQVLEVGEVRKMNDKERLQEIKEKFTLMNDFAELCQTGTCTLSLKDYDWLIRRVEQLQEEIAQLKLEKEAAIEGFNEQVKLAVDCIEENTRLREQLQQAKAKLERYKEIANLFRIAFANGEAEHRSANGRSMQAMALLEELES